MEGPVSLAIPEDELKDIVEKSKDWALMHGVGIKSRDNYSKDSINFAPFSLFPSPFPRKQFTKAVEIQTVLNELMHRVAHNRQFLTETLQYTIQVDEFTGNLFKIYETVQEEGVTQKCSLGLFRSDYMVHNGEKIKQVEFNTIASSFGGIASVLRHFNSYVLQELGHGSKLENLPANNALQGLCQGMLDAWKFYGDPKAVICFIVEDITYNICDQRFHEFEIRRQNPSVKVIRKTLTEVANCASLGPKKELIVGTDVVSVVYFRAGYEPGQYHGQKEWDARLLIERSLAIKCPSIHYHLAGTKKVQQALARPGTIEMFIGDAIKIEAVKEMFTGLYSLDFDEFGEQAIQMALAEPDRFILKPQREGGGNNIYGSDVKDAILNMRESKERSAWILMERIWPPITKGHVVRPGGADAPPIVDLISELGIYGVVLGDDSNIKINRQVGHMLRTKLSTANEGGVAAGQGCLDSPYLID